MGGAAVADEEIIRRETAEANPQTGPTILF
jgi:hypothetical protein